MLHQYCDRSGKGMKTAWLAGSVQDERRGANDDA